VTLSRFEQRLKWKTSNERRNESELAILFTFLQRKASDSDLSFRNGNDDALFNFRPEFSGGEFASKSDIDYIIPQ